MHGICRGLIGSTPQNISALTFSSESLGEDLGTTRS
jgi:hypothetical protein